MYHFTSITVGAGVRLTMHSAVEGPVTWLASGPVVIDVDGLIDLNGERGHSNTEARRRSTPGAGGYSGGAGANTQFGVLPENGGGPGGGGAAADPAENGGDAGHAQPGAAGPNAGSPYGHPSLLPVVGGSGGGGGDFGLDAPSSGGSAGGGALLVASSDSITVDGAISAESGCVSTSGSGEGSGGAIRLVAPGLAGNGALLARSCMGNGSFGRIRLETVQNQFTGFVLPPASLSLPGIVSIPPADLPLRVVAVAGVPVPADPRGTFTPPDVVVNTTGPVTVDVEGRGVPLGTTVNVSMFLENGDVVTVVSTPLAGTVALSTATATVTIPAGFVSFFVEASWGP